MASLLDDPPPIAPSVVGKETEHGRPIHGRNSVTGYVITRPLRDEKRPIRVQRVTIGGGSIVETAPAGFNVIQTSIGAVLAAEEQQRYELARAANYVDSAEWNQFADELEEFTSMEKNRNEMLERQAGVIQCCSKALRRAVEKKIKTLKKLNKARRYRMTISH